MKAFAHLNADGSLRGQLTSNVGEMMWKAVRTRAK
jgi:hypothetical protein